jgi:uncharacterized protein YbjT (DUF2867 family)
MLVTIAGGHGRIALRLARRLARDGHAVRSLIRNPAHMGDVQATGAEAVVLDLETAGQAEVDAAVAGADAVVFAAGAGPGSGAERKWTVDHGAAIKLIEAAKAGHVDRYVMVSAMGADPDAAGDDVFQVYLRAKGQADAALRASGLAWTVLRPGGLTDDPPTGAVRLAPETPRGSIPREDVAAVLEAILHAPGLAGRTLDVIAGPTPVAEAVAAL